MTQSNNYRISYSITFLLPRRCVQNDRWNHILIRDSSDLFQQVDKIVLKKFSILFAIDLTIKEMWSNEVVSKNTRPNVHQSDLRMRLLHSVRILGGPVQVMAVDVVIIVENTFVREQNVFGKMITFLTYIKELSTISQSASFIINMH